MTATGPGTSRRNLIKAAGAAGIIWTAPVIRPVTAHAAGGTCTRVQYDFPAGAFVTPTDTDEDLFTALGFGGLGCDACLPGGQVFASTCSCTGGWSAGVDGTGGSVSPGDPSVGNTYTVPANCHIVNASALLFRSGESGCAATFPCVTSSSGLTVSPGETQLTLPTPDGVYLRLRVLLCCPP